MGRFEDPKDSQNHYRNYMTFEKTKDYLRNLDYTVDKSIRYMQESRMRGIDPIQNLRDAMSRESSWIKTKRRFDA